MGLIEIGTGVILSRAGCGVVGDREVRPFSVVGVQRALTCIAMYVSKDTVIRCTGLDLFR